MTTSPAPIPDLAALVAQTAALVGQATAVAEHHHETCCDLDATAHAREQVAQHEADLAFDRDREASYAEIAARVDALSDAEFEQAYGISRAEQTRLAAQYAEDHRDRGHGDDGW